jgi:8-oxo-dGTP diphosphatase
MKKEYVLGFATSEGEKSYGEVVFIKKTKPEWQAGLKNGVGGKIEEGETSIQAMVREFEEETSVKTESSQWKSYCTLENSQFIIYVFMGLISDEQMDAVKTTTDEEVSKHTYYYVMGHIEEFIDNIPWILHMIFDNALLRGNIQVIYPEF